MIILHWYGTCVTTNSPTLIDAVLWPKVIVYSDFRFLSNVLFLFWGPSQDITLRAAVVAPQAPWAVTVSHFPWFWWPWQFWGVLVTHFVLCHSIWVCLMVFSRLDWAHGFGRKTTEGKALLIASYRGPTLPTGLTSVEADWNLSLTFPFPAGLLGKSHSPQPTLGGGSYVPLPRRRSIYIDCLKFFCMGNLSIRPIYLFIQSFIPVWTHGYISYTVLYSNTYSFGCSNCCNFGHWELSQRALDFFDSHTHHYVCFSALSFFMVLQGAPGSYWYSVLESAISPRSYGSF